MTPGGGLLRLLAAAATGAGLFLSGLLLPVPFPLPLLLSPIPLLWLTRRDGPRAGLLGCLFAVTLTMPLLPLQAVVSFATEHALLGWLTGLLLRRGKGFSATALRGAIVSTGASLFASLVLAVFSGLGLRAYVHYQLDELMLQTRTLLEGMPSGGGVEATQAVTLFLDFIVRAFPALFFLGHLLEAGACLLLVSPFFARAGLPLPPLRLARLRLDERLIWVLIPALAALWIPAAPVRVTAINIIIVLLFFYLLQGIGIAFHLGMRLKLPRGAALFAAAGFILLPSLLAVPLAAGLLDFKFDFRTRWPLPDDTAPHDN